MCLSSWDEIKRMRQADHTFTVTTLYQAMIHKLWRKDILRLEKQDHGIPLTAEIVDALRYSKRFMRAVQSESDFLSALAFDRFQENQIEFTDREIDHVIEKLEAKGMQLPLTLESNLTKLSFLHADDRDVGRDQRSYHFMHLTFQEFFAAQWLARLLTSDPSQVEDCVRRHKYDPRYEIVWRFMAGLLPDDAALNSFFDWLDQGPQDLLGIQHQHLIMHCLNESKARLNNPERQQTLELNLCEWVEFEIKTMGNSTLGVQVAFPEAQLLQWLMGEPRRADIIAVLAKRPVLSKEAIECLTALLKDTDNSVRSGAAQALGTQSNLPPEAIEGLIALLKDTNDFVRSRAAEVLCKRSNLPPKAIEDLVALLMDKNSFMRSKFVVASDWRLNLPPEAIEGLIALLKTTDNPVRFRAAEELRTQSNLPPKAIEGLMTLLTDTDSFVRSSAAEALGRQSNLPPEATESLIPLLKDTGYLRVLAVQALDRQRTGQLYRRLETLERSSMECLYSQYLVKWSVARIAPLYLEGSTLYFYASSKLKSVSLREEAAFRQTLLEVQKRTGIPSASWVKTSKAVVATAIEHPAYAWPTWRRPTGVKGGGKRRRSRSGGDEFEGAGAEKPFHAGQHEQSCFNLENRKAETKRR
jgi:hypothetical protein